MFILTMHWDVRAAWTILTATSKFYIVCLLAAAVYSTYSIVRIALRLHQLLKKDVTPTAEKNVRFQLIQMTRGVETSRQFQTLLFLLFGVCCANEIFATFRVIKYSAMSLSGARIEVFEPVAAFAFVVFVVLFFLHAFQWIVAARLQSAFAANANHAAL